MIKNTKIYSYCFLTLCLGFFTYGCDKMEGDQKSDMISYAPTPGDKFKLSSLQELEELIWLADEKEDVSAMKRLADYFGYNLQQSGMSFYWQERAANAGDVDSRNFLVEHYLSSLDEDEKKKAQNLVEKWKCKLSTEDGISSYECPNM